MGREVLHELVDRVHENELELVYFVLSRVVRGGIEETEPLPDEIEAIREYEAGKAKGEHLYSHEEVFGKKPTESVAV